MKRFSLTEWLSTPTKTNMLQCKDCQAFVCTVKDSSEGECRRCAPVITDFSHNGYWPYVQPWSGCLEGVPKTDCGNQEPCERILQPLPNQCG